MAEIRRGIGADNRVERLPWLEPVEDEDDGPERHGGARWAVLGLAGLAILALLVAGGIMAGRWHAAHADIGGVIRAPATPYKVRAPDNGGLAATTGDVVAERTGTGADIDAPLALVAPEQPVVGPGSRAADDAAPSPAQPRPAPTARSAPIVLAAPKPAAPPPGAPAGATPAPAPAPVATGGGTVQLGAFSSEAKAKAAWKSLSKRFGYLQPMAMSITPAEANGATVYRLRASGGEPAGQLCARLELAGEACAVIG